MGSQALGTGFGDAVGARATRRTARDDARAMRTTRITIVHSMRSVDHAMNGIIARR